MITQQKGTSSLLYLPLYRYAIRLGIAVTIPQMIFVSSLLLGNSLLIFMEKGAKSILQQRQTIHKQTNVGIFEYIMIGRASFYASLNMHYALYAKVIEIFLGNN